MIALGLKKHPGYMPIGATCSAVLSAACHGPYNDKTSVKPLRWGVVDIPSHDRASPGFNEHTRASPSTADIVTRHYDDTIEHVHSPLMDGSSDEEFRHIPENFNGQFPDQRVTQLWPQDINCSGRCCIATPDTVRFPKVDEYYI
jgi:hypothetical protein